MYIITDRIENGSVTEHHL